MKNIFSFLFIVLIISNLSGQKVDTIDVRKNLLIQSIIPVTFISTGVLVNNSVFEQNLQTNLRNIVGNDFEFVIDDYIQYAPIAEMYIADIFHMKAKNHWFDQTKYLLISNLISSSITHGLKNLTLKTRPNGGSFSFPSGHTTFAFTNATVFFNEFQNTSLLFASTAYLFSTTTGIFRMLNNKHWLSDVLVGAGIGIIVTEAVYYFEPFKNFNPFKKSKNLTFSPIMTDEYNGFVFLFYF